MSAIEDALLQAALAGVNVTAARAELAALRAQAAELHDAHVYLDESYINDPDATPLKLADRIAPLIAQAAQAEALQARVTVLEQAAEKDIQALTGIISGWRDYATGHYCQTYNIGMAAGLESAADALEAYVNGITQRNAAHAPAQPEQEQAG